MKKAVIIIGLILTFILIYLLQANLFEWFTIAGVKPNLFIILVLFIGLFTGRNMGITFGIIFGLMLDLFIGKKIGISSIFLGSIGFLGGYFDKSFSKDSKITIMLMVVGATVVYELGNFMINAIIFSYTIDGARIAITLGIEVIYNVILTIILYPLMQRVGVYMEDIFKGNKILTRYF